MLSANRGDAGGKIIVNITPPAGHTARVEERNQGGDLNVDVFVELVENKMASNLRSGRGSHAAALADTFGMERRPR